MRGDYVRAIGWLSAEHDFPTGDVSPDLITRLTEFGDRGGGQREIGWGIFMGKHTCELCRAYEMASEIAVPSPNALYVAPSMLSHYIEVHRYAPPTEFATALMASPLPGTDEYRLAVAEFRRLYWSRVKEGEQQQKERAIDTAADWVARHGGDENAIQAWKRMFWRDPQVSPKMCGSPEATLAYLDREEKRFFDLVRARVEIIKKTKEGA